MKEFFLFYSVKFFGQFVRFLPLAWALRVGRGIGQLAYCFIFKHRRQAYANIRTALAATKSSEEIQQITKKLFQNYGQNFIELFRMPLMNKERFKELVTVEGKGNIDQALQKGKGVILLAMHFGSWEIASLSCGLMGYPYKMFANPQTKHSRLDDLLNSYRSAGGSVILSEGMGPRDFVRSLKNNEVIGMVVDQGGRDGALVPFFDRQASMSMGAIRMGLKMDVPICFSIIIRGKNGHHRMVIHSPLELEKTGDQEKDIQRNLKKVVQMMEQYIVEYPSEYMWFYKIWKYSKDRKIVILSDAKTGHLRQSETVAALMEQAVANRDMNIQTQMAEVCFRTDLAYRMVSLWGVFFSFFPELGNMSVLKRFLTKDSYEKIQSMTADYVISCGSSTACVNRFLARSQLAKSIAILKPGALPYKEFDLTILPQHDVLNEDQKDSHIVTTRGAPNLITEKYLQEQSQLLLSRFSHLKSNVRFKIGVFIGGSSKNLILTERQVKILSRQLDEVARELNACLLITTSRRTPKHIERLLHRKFKKNPRCVLLILANQENVSEAVGGILGLSDMVIVSGDSISMVSEAASSGKNTIVFSPETRAKVLKGKNKHKTFIDKLNAQGYIRSSDVKHMGQSIYDLVKNKIYTRLLEDNKIIREALEKIV